MIAIQLQVDTWEASQEVSEPEIQVRRRWWGLQRQVEDEVLCGLFEVSVFVW